MAVLAVGGLSIFWSGPAVGTASAISSPPTSPGFSGLNCSVSLGPEAPVWDHANGLIYVPTTRNIAVINGTCGAVGSVTLPNAAHATVGAYDPLNGDVYFLAPVNRTIYLVRNLTVVHSMRIHTSGTPTAIAWDPPGHLMLVTIANGHMGRGYGTLIGLSGTAIQSGAATVGKNPLYLAYDARGDVVWIVNWLSGNATGVNASRPFSGTHLSVLTGKAPEGITCSAADGLCYAEPTYVRPKMTIFNETGSVVATLPDQHFLAIGVYAGVSGLVYLAGNTRGDIVVFNGTVRETPIPYPAGVTYFNGMAYDNATKEIYLTEPSGSRVYVLVP